MNHQITEMKNKINEILTKQELEAGQIARFKAGQLTDEDGITRTLSVEACDRHGEFEQLLTTIAHGHEWASTTKNRTVCPGCLRDARELLLIQIDELESEQRQRDIEHHQQRRNVPKRFQNASFENYQPVNEQARRNRDLCLRYANRFPERQSVGGGLVLCGKPGTGKTHLAAAVIHEVIDAFALSARYTTAMRIARNVKESWGTDESEADVMGDYIAPDLLVIDEVGVQYGSETEKLVLFEVINGRYNEVKPTILISNLSAAELEEFVGARVMDRMREGGGYVMPFDWDSYRRGGGK